MFVTAAIDMNSLKSDISSTESRQFYFGAGAFKSSQRVKKAPPNFSQNLEKEVKTLRREGFQHSQPRPTKQAGIETGSRGITIKWN